MRIDEVVRAAVPNASDGFIEHILWGRTPYPMGRITAKSLYKAARRVDRASKNGIRLCDLCDNQVTGSGWECDKCHAVMAAIRESDNA